VEEVQTFRKKVNDLKPKSNQAEGDFLRINAEDTAKLVEGFRVHRDSHTSRKMLRWHDNPTDMQQDELSSQHQLHRPRHRLPVITHHLRKRSASLQEPSRAPLSKPLKKHRAPTQNFTLDIQGEQVQLLYGKEPIINMTSPTKIHITSKDTVSYNRKTISVISGSMEVKRFSHIAKLAIYSKKGMSKKRATNKGIVLRAGSAELYVSGDTGFYSLSRNFNALLSKRLAEIVANSRHSRIPIEFRVFTGGRTLLTVNNTSIIVLTDAEFRSISDQQTILYENNILHILEDTQVGTVEVFPDIEHLLTLNNLGPRGGVAKHTSSLARKLHGRGDLYVHKQTKTAFYSRDPVLNDKVSEFLVGQGTYLNNLVFSIRFEASSSGGPLEVVIAANGEDILRLKPHHVIDQSVATRHRVSYTNNTVYVMNGEEVLDAIEGIKEIRSHKEDRLLIYTTETSEEIVGGGQLFTCQGQGLYSLDTDLNDRIGDALLGAESHPPMPPSLSGCSSQCEQKNAPKNHKARF
jgi:hypothetical protein